MALTQRFEIGTEYTVTRGKGKKAYTRNFKIVDVLRTYNSENELVSLRYVASHNLLGQDILDRDVVDMTITRALHAEGRLDEVLAKLAT